jgi:type II secretory pathway component PulJ
LILAIIILAALSLAVWAGLHFYQKSQRNRSANQQNRLREFASAISPRMLNNLISKAEENDHGFIA